MINGFGSAKEQWFSSFMLQVEANCSPAPPVRRPAQPGDVLLKGPDFEYMQARRQEGSISTMRYTDWRAATLKTKWLSLNPEYR